MVKIGFITNGDSEACIKFDEMRIIRENNLSGSFFQTAYDNLKSEPVRENEKRLYNYGNGGWFASGTIFGQVTAGAQILFDPDKNKTQEGPHWTIQGKINVSGGSVYDIPVGPLHRIYSNKNLEVIFYNQDGTVSGTTVLVPPGKV